MDKMMYNLDLVFMIVLDMKTRNTECYSRKMNPHE